MVRLYALSAGEHAPRHRFAGAIHSVFEKACNIQLDDGRLLCLLLPQLANLPHGIRIEAAPALDFSHHLRAGQRVGCRASVLRLGEAGLAIDLRSACLWRSELSRPGVNLDRPEAALAWRAAWSALARHERGDPGARDPKRLDQAKLAVSRPIRCGARLFARRCASPVRPVGFEPTGPASRSIV